LFTFIINAFKVIFVLGFLVLIHEGGHFLVAKLFKVKVNEIKEKILPELDDEFAKDVSEFDTLEDYKKDLQKVVKERKEKQAKATLIDVNDEAKVGVIITETVDIKSDYNVDLKFKGTESGSSGGLMMTLTIYSYLNNIDLTHGKKIVGTGTIDREGNVGEISGIKYKLMGAVKEKADVFLVPQGENYKEARNLKNEKGYDIDIVPVETFQQALTYLKEL